VSAACPLFGFEVVFHLTPGLGDAAAAALWRDLVAGPIERRGLVCVGGIAGGRWSHVVHGEAGQATDADRQAVAAWALSRPEIAAADVGPLVDVTSLV
jgi:uncharacterized protein YggL (DUF469 family)